VSSTGVLHYPRSTSRQGAASSRQKTAGRLQLTAGRLKIKFEILRTKHVTNPNDQNSNDQNGKDGNSFLSFRLGHWRIRILNLFRISIFGFRIYLHALCFLFKCSRLHDKITIRLKSGTSRESLKRSKENGANLRCLTLCSMPYALCLLDSDSWLLTPCRR
jgi:hypothetical protein